METRDKIKKYLDEEKIKKRSKKEIDEILDIYRKKREELTKANYSKSDRDDYSILCEKIAGVTLYDSLKSQFRDLQEGVFEYIFNTINTNYYKNILDMGSGTGLEAVFLAENFPSSRITGIDINKKMNKEAKERAKRRNILKTNFVTADIDYLPFRDKEFDLVLCLNSLIDDEEDNAPPSIRENILNERIKEFRRTLDKRGKLIILNSFDHNSEECREYETEKMKGKIEYAKFSEPESFEFNFKDNQNVEHNYALISAIAL